MSYIDSQAMESNQTARERGARTIAVAHQVEQQFHKTMYYSLQSLRGRHVGPFVQRLQQWEKLDSEQFERLTARLLQTALSFAARRVPLYSTGPWREALQSADPTDLSIWPILERSMLVTHR